MNGVDYTKQLAKERDFYQDSIQKNKQATDKRIADVEKQTDEVKTKQRDHFIEDKAELEQSYQKSLNHLKDRTAASIDENRSKSNNDLTKEREQFTKEAMSKSKDFDQRLDDIKSSYQKSFVSEKENHEELQKSKKNSYQRNTDDLVKKTDKSLSNYQDKMKHAGADLKDQYSRERQQLVRHHEDNLLSVYKDNSEKRAAQREQINLDTKKTREVHEADITNQKQYTGDRMSNLQKQYQDRFEGMAKDYSQRSDNLAESQQKLQVKTNKEHQEHLDGVRRDYNKQMRMVELDKRRRDNGSGEFSNVVEKQQGQKNEQVMTDRLNQMKEDLGNAKNSYQARAQENQDSFNESLRIESAKATANLDRKLFDANADKLVNVSHEREKAHNQVSNRERQNKIDRETFDRELHLEKTNAKTRLTKLKENFNTSMKSLEEKHRNDIAEVSETATTDKIAFQKDLNERRNNELFEMKREFTKLLDTTVLDYENRLGVYQRENDSLRLSMDQKVQNIMDQMDKALETERKLSNDKRIADTRSHQLLVDQKENHLKKQMSELNTNYQRKMDVMQVENDRKMNLLTNEYENKLKQFASTKGKEMIDKDMTHAQELERLKAAYQEEKARMVSQNQSQLDLTKKNHAEQMEQMRNFKSLS